jgi:hypothetical protein
VRRTYGLWELATALALTMVRVVWLVGSRIRGRVKVLARAVSMVATVSLAATVGVTATVKRVAHIVDEEGEEAGKQGGNGAPSNIHRYFCKGDLRKACCKSGPRFESSVWTPISPGLFDFGMEKC